MNLLDSIPRTFEPALPWPWLAALAAIGFLATIATARRARFPIATALLQLLALAWLLLVLANPVRRGELRVLAPAGAQVVLLDTSASMSLGGAQPRWREGLAWAAPLLDAKEARLVTFDAGCDLSGAAPTDAKGSASRLAQALERVTAGDAPPAHLVVVSDGVFDDPREIDRALAKLRERQIAVSTHVVGRDEVVPNLFLRRIDAPRFAPAESQVTVRIDVGAIGLPPETRAMLRLLGEDQRVLAEREWSGEPIELAIPFGLRAEQIAAQLAPVAGEVSAADNIATFRLEPLHPKIRVFYAEGSKGYMPFGDDRLNAVRFYLEPFRRAGIECDIFQMPGDEKRGQPVHYVSGFDDEDWVILDPTRSIPSDREGWWRYDVIIISDIDREIFMPHMESVLALVAERGGGFLMNGGYQSFDTGYYDQTLWEKLLPVDCFQFGYGIGTRTTAAYFPAAVRAHPILQLTPNAMLNERILALHPTFRGYHDIRRVKPGAVTLARVPGSEAPLVAVQDYGRGRSMAFLSDPVGGWGKDYAGVWGPALLADDDANAVPGEREFIEDPSLAINEFYNRFWVNSIRWLAAHSVRRQERPLLGRAATATVRPGETLAVSAELRTGDAVDALGVWSVGVRAGASGVRVPLRFDRDRGEFVGEVSVPAAAEAGAVALLFDALSGAKSFSDAVTVPVVRFEREYERTAPDARFMADIARAGGGRVLQDAEEARAVVESVRRAAAEMRVPFTQPLWDRAWMWAIFLAIVGLKWWLWRLGRSRASAPASRDEPPPGPPSANGAPPSQPGATPQETQGARASTEGAFHPIESRFQRFLATCRKSWGVAPGWDEAAPLARRRAAGALRVFGLSAVLAFISPKVARGADDGRPPITKVARVCVIFGHPGDDDHRETYKTLGLHLARAWRARFGLPDDAIRVSEAAPREEVLALVRESIAVARPDAAVWFLFIGHGNQTRTGANFNLPGPDLTEKDLRETLEATPALSPLVLLCTQAASGRWVRSIAGPGRHLFVATRSYDQDNETELPTALVGALGAVETDANGDGVVTLLEIFEACRTGVAAIYEGRRYVQMETPGLDANGDARATTRPAPDDAAAAARIGLQVLRHSTPP